jgi:hypothetical protein
LSVNLDRDTLAEDYVCDFCWWSARNPEVELPGQIASETAFLSLWAPEEEGGAA